MQTKSVVVYVVNATYLNPCTATVYTDTYTAYVVCVYNHYGK